MIVSFSATLAQAVIARRLEHIIDQDEAYMKATRVREELTQLLF